MLWWDPCSPEAANAGHSQRKALARDPKERTVWDFARQHFVSMHESSQIICSLWFCKDWCRSNKVSNIISKANISHLTSVIPEVHVSYLTFILLFLRRLDELRGENCNGLWDLSHLQPILLSSSTLCWGSSLLYKSLKGWFTKTLRKTIVHLFLSNILQGSDPAPPHQKEFSVTGVAGEREWNKVTLLSLPQFNELL